ncbi:MAG: hypothetical protein EAZ07_05210 [Cytophagales bacterium]|nr:MAG: hypothetical protein EAZ07_05210 [Cytophagales bacterium]
MKLSAKSNLVYLFCFVINAHFLHSQSVNSSFGKVFTPKGSLRALIIYAGFEGFEEREEGADWKGEANTPNWRHEELFYDKEEQFSRSYLDTNIDNISKFYYEMSNPNHPLKLMMDVFPKRINIDPSGAYNFGNLNRRVIEKIKTEFPDFDWSRYDSRTNSPNYVFDNSNSLPDKKPDYIIIAYRLRKSWSKLPNLSMLNWAGNYSVLDGLYGLEFNGYTFDGSGFTMGDFDCRKGDFKTLFLHELAHELYSCPHYSGGALGNYFYLASGGSDMMCPWRGQIANAFERWLLGWIEIKHDLNSYKHNGRYRLRDFVSTGDAIRLKIPNTENQYIWIENRQGKSIFDRNIWRGQLYNHPIGSKGIADRDKGLNLYIEEVVSQRDKISSGLVYDLDKVNGLLPINARGNYDFPKPKKLTHTNHSYPYEQQINWNNPTYWFEQGLPNPISGINPFMLYRNDMDSNGRINADIGPFGEFNGMKDTESFQIAMEKVKDTFLLTYGFIGGQNQDVKHRHPDTFIKGDEAGMSFNPVLINRPRYHREHDSIAPYYINGIYIKVLSDKKGVVKLKIKFNENNIVNDTRWCGNIICKKIEKAKKGYDINIMPRVTLTIDKSGTINNAKQSHINFISSTHMVLDSGTVMHISRNANLKIINGSKLIVKKGAKIIVEKNAKIELDKISFLELDSPEGVLYK